MAKKNAVVVGGLGIIGRHIISALENDGGWNITTLSRRKPDFRTKARAIQVDLLNKKEAEKKLAKLSNTTHIFYSALAGGIAAENVEGNVNLVKHSVGSIAPIAPKLERVVLSQGGKFYGCHLGHHKTPSIETDPRHMPPNFYYDQQDALARLQRGKKWSYSLVRPEVVVGFAPGIPLNFFAILAIYATICRELKIPLNFPGPDAAFNALNRYTDAELLGRSMLWMASEPKCANEVFNMTNDSGFRWANVWPKIADYFGCEMGVCMPMQLSMFMEDKRPVWNKIMKKHNLKADIYENLSWEFADWNFNRTWDTLLEDVKRIQYGYHEVMDSWECFKGTFDKIKKNKGIPNIK
tara:strand:+ start:62643 stop:63698 length:1056 start_codon:yes stop_codon:yes gene_type:complete